MTPPRQVLAGTTYLMSRRCSQQQFLLLPGALTNAVFKYALARAAQNHGMKIHAYLVMSNHYHLVVTDPGARLPAFAQQLHSLVARALNASLGRREHFWGLASFSATSLTSPADVVEKAAYALANPVAAGLVHSCRQWPGLWSAPESIGAGAVAVERPRHFFDPEGDLPESVPLELCSPPGFVSAEEFRVQLLAALGEQEAAAVKATRHFLGASKVLAQRPSDRPATREPLGSLSPRVAGKDPLKRMEALRRLKEFVGTYRQVLLEWREGAREVIFPSGTYLMRVVHGVACAGVG